MDEVLLKIEDAIKAVDDALAMFPDDWDWRKQDENPQIELLVARTRLLTAQKMQAYRLRMAPA